MPDKEAVIQIYLDVLNGVRSRFPNHFFDGIDGKQRVIIITRYLIEEHLEIEIDKIPERVSAELLWKYRLRPPTTLQGWNFSDLMENCYAEDFKAWNFRQVSNGYWQREGGRQRAIDAVKYVIEVQCQIPLYDIPNQITADWIKEHSLGGLFNRFAQSPYELVNAVYPGLFRPWEFHMVPMNYWKDKGHVENAMNWLLFDRLRFSSYEESMSSLRARHFREHGIGGLFERGFNHRMWRVLHWISEQMKLNKESIPS